MKLIYKISILFIGVVIFFLVVFSSISNYFGEDEIFLTEQEIINDCSNLDLFDTSICLKENIETFFIYNITEDNISLNFNELKERGGDCRNWAFLYERLGKGLNFNSSTVKNDGVKEVFNAHRYTVLWDNNSYCKLNMIDDVECYEIDY